ncbi:hypothetical protein C0J52_01397 [Blattella germanica]|nr:hypothetical protein C0J52_01397 [Blattella germanica]
MKLIIPNIDDSSLLPPCLELITKINTSGRQNAPMNIKRASVHNKCHITQFTSLQKSEIKPTLRFLIYNMYFKDINQKKLNCRLRRVIKSVQNFHKWLDTCLTAESQFQQFLCHATTQRFLGRGLAGWGPPAEFTFVEVQNALYLNMTQDVGNVTLLLLDISQKVYFFMFNIYAANIFKGNTTRGAYEGGQARFEACPLPSRSLLSNLSEGPK